MAENIIKYIVKTITLLLMIICYISEISLIVFAAIYFATGSYERCIAVSLLIVVLEVSKISTKIGYIFKEIEKKS